MTKEFTTYEIAVKLKELGFDEECLGIWKINGDDADLNYKSTLNFKSQEQVDYVYGNTILAPLWQQAINWIRCEKGIDLYVNKVYDRLWQYSYHRFGVIIEINEQSRNSSWYR